VTTQNIWKIKLCPALYILHTGTIFTLKSDTMNWQ